MKKVTVGGSGEDWLVGNQNKSLGLFCVEVIRTDQEQFSEGETNVV